MTWPILESASLHFPTKKTMRIWTVRIESFIFCRRTPLNSQNSIRKKFEQVGDIPEISVLGNRKINDIQVILFMKTKVIDQFGETENRDVNIVRA